MLLDTIKSLFNFSVELSEKYSIQLPGAGIKDFFDDMDVPKLYSKHSKQFYVIYLLEKLVLKPL